MKYLYSLLLLTFFFSPLLHAQSEEELGKIRGYVYDAEDREPIPFASLLIEDLNLNTITNADGYFVFNNIPPGIYTVRVLSTGYVDTRFDVQIRAGKIRSENVFMEVSSQFIDEVEVNADRSESRSKVQTGKVTLSNKEIKDLSVGGDADVIRAMQVIPGVVTTGDQGTQLYIRGGLPIQNLILLDGMMVYNPFHSIGFYSVFDPDIIRTADVYSAGFNAEYGSRTSAVMDIRTRPGNRKRQTGKLSMSTLAGKLLLEGPLSKNKDANGFASTSYLISAKTSLLDQTAPFLYPYVESQFGGLPFVFTDLYGKISTTGSDGSSFNLFGFRFDDAVSFQPNNFVGWTSSGAGMDFTVTPPGSTVLIKGDFAYSSYSIEADYGDERPRQSDINAFNAGLDFIYFIGESDELSYGLEAIGYNTDFRYVNAAGRNFNQEAFTTELGSYFKYRIKRNRFIIEPGLRLHYYGSLGELSVEPRFGAKYLLNESIRLKASAGIYSQNLVAAISDREVVNLFYGFLSGSVNLPNEFRGEPINTLRQRAQHVVLGGEFDLNRTFTLTAEGYMKYFGHVTNINRNKIYEENDFERPEILRMDYIVERGMAYGVDFLLKGKWKKLDVWTGYSYAIVDRDDGIIQYYPIFDRRHNLNLVGNYTWGKRKNEWQVSLRYNFGTGFPFTPNQGNYPLLDFTDQLSRPDVSYDYTSENGEIGFIYGDINTSRLPNYHRLDFSIKKLFQMGAYSSLELGAGATNVMNRENVFYFDRNAFQRIDQLPIIPTVSAIYTF